MSMKDAYQQKLEARLDEWRAEIDKMRAKADEAEVDAKIEYQAQLENLQQARQEAEAKLEERRQSGDAAWETSAACRAIGAAWIRRCAGRASGSINSAARKERGVWLPEMICRQTASWGALKAGR